MAPVTQKGDVAELAVALDLRRRGFRVAIPLGEDQDYDLIIDWIAVYDGTTRTGISLHLTPARNCQIRGIRQAANFLEF